MYLGACPVLLDVSPSSWTLDPNLVVEVLAKLRREGKKVAAVVPTDIYGQSCDLDALKEAAGPFNIPVVSDSAEALGARYKERSVGVGGAAAAFSFNGNKIITTTSGGMLVSFSEALIKEARFLSQQARDPAPHYQHSTIGYNYRMSNLLAAVGRAQLRVLSDRVKRRREIYQTYRALLDDVPGISFMPEAPYGRCTRWLTVILIDPKAFGSDREQVRLSLSEQGIESRPVWKPMHLQPVFANAPYFGGVVSEQLFRDGLCLPSGTQLTDNEIGQIAEIVKTLGKADRRI
jgi:dTDP-4-amino-4,6-dideoxygalactose transaminase